MQKKVKTIIIYIFIFVFIIVGYGISNIFSYVRYDDSSDVSSYLIELENKDLNNKIKEISDLVNSEELVNEYVLGRVIYRNMYDFYERIVIKVEDDVNVGNAVVNGEGLVGIVSSIKDDKVYVSLLSSKYNVSVSVGDCYGNLSNGKVDMVSKECNVGIGDKVVTSGLNEISKGIYIGKVVNVKEEDLGYVLDVELINNKHLNYVGVIK